MVTLREINEDNFNECLKLEVFENQKKFVSPNVRSLAQAWLYPKDARPFAIYNDETMVGFLMLDIDLHSDGLHKTCELWRLMIDKDHQGKGFGKGAMEEMISYVKNTYNSQFIRTSYVPENINAKKLYESFGFEETGDIESGQIVMLKKIL